MKDVLGAFNETAVELSDLGIADQRRTAGGMWLGIAGIEAIAIGI